MKKIFLIATLVISSAVIIVGMVVMNITCDGSCNSSNHRGENDDICPRFFFPSMGSTLMIVIGGLGVLAVLFYMVISKKTPVKS